MLVEKLQCRRPPLNGWGRIAAQKFRFIIIRHGQPRLCQSARTASPPIMYATMHFGRMFQDIVLYGIMAV